MVRLISDIIAGKIYSITFTTPPSVHDLTKIAQANQISHALKKSLSMVTVVAVGPSTKNALERNGINVHVTPQVSRLDL